MLQFNRAWNDAKPHSALISSIIVGISWIFMRRSKKANLAKFLRAAFRRMSYGRLICVNKSIVAASQKESAGNEIFSDASCIILAYCREIYAAGSCVARGSVKKARGRPPASGAPPKTSRRKSDVVFRAHEPE